MEDQSIEIDSPRQVVSTSRRLLNKVSKDKRQPFIDIIPNIFLKETHLIICKAKNERQQQS